MAAAREVSAPAASLTPAASPAPAATLMPTPSILAVHSSPTHTFTKHPQLFLRLLAGQGVEGDAHCGATVRHRYLVRRNPSAPNRMQVHLLAAEFLDDLSAPSFGLPPILPGHFGENITTRDLDLISLPLGTQLHLGPDAVIELTGLRSPCKQMNTLRLGLMQAAFSPGTRNPRAGVMAIVLSGGMIRPADAITVTLPALPYQPLRPI